MSKIFLGLLLFRLFINTYLVQTFFSPDEYYQLIEVSYSIVFPEKPSTLTWEWVTSNTIRGYLHPIIFAIPLFVCKELLGESLLWKLVTPWTFFKMVEAFFQACTDYFTIQLGSVLLGQSIKTKTQKLNWVPMLLWHVVLDWFCFYCGVSPFSNSLETCLTTMALYMYYKFENATHHVDKYWKFLYLAGFAVVVRPTNLFIWIPFLLLRRPFSTKDVMMGIAPMVLLWLFISIALDTFMYGQFTFVMWNFIQFNVIQQMSHLYGVQPWHWYFTQGLPVILGFQVIPFLWACKSFKNFTRNLKFLFLILIYVITVYSVFAHKEFRFIFPIVPICIIYISIGTQNLKERSQSSFIWKVLVAMYVILNVIIMLYFSLVHQRGTMDVVRVLNDKIPNEKLTNVLFLMPCHHVPSYAMFASKQVTLRHLDCAPFAPHTLTRYSTWHHYVSNSTHYIDESELFYENPIGFLSSTKLFESFDFDFVVMYEELYDQLRERVNIGVRIN